MAQTEEEPDLGDEDREVEALLAAAAGRSLQLGAGSWSYFGDPRAISHDGHTFTGWISTAGHVWIARLTARGKLTKHLLFRGLGRDDHNNPSLVFRHDGRIVAFFSPHSGRDLPPPGIPSRMYYRVSKRPYSIDDGWERTRTVATNAPGSLGYTYPNPMQLRDKLWLFWRGGGWNPTFSYTENLRDWVPARELVRSVPGQRPYAKYVTDGRDEIHGIFTNGHVTDFDNSLYYFRYEGRDIHTASGRRIASLDDVPLRVGEFDTVYAFDTRWGAAWPHDIALDRDGRPVLVYTRRRGGRDYFYYAHFNGNRWVSRLIVGAGAGRRSFTSGGASLDHEDPRIVYLSRTIGAWNQVEAWTTGDRGQNWNTLRLTDNPNGYSIRPVSPRGLRGAGRIVFVRGDERTIGFTDYTTRIRALDF